jgi:type IV secretory pathway TraG/TraD family ATPase VirD4
VPLPAKLPRFHPATVIRELGDGEKFSISDATTGVAVFGATGSGKTTGTGEFFGKGYMGSAAEMGMLILCAKVTEKDQTIRWAEETGRGKDVRVFDASGDRFRFNFLDWISGFAAEGAGLTINVVAFLEELITALEPQKAVSGGDNVFWEDSLHQMLVEDVELVQLAGYELSFPTLRDIVRSAPLSPEQAKDPKWQETNACWFFLEQARLRSESADAETQADYAECRAYWLDDFASLSEKTRSIIKLMFTKLAQPFTTRPLRKLCCTDTTLKPEDTFDGAIIIVSPSTQEYRRVGLILALLWKYAWQVAVMRRKPAPEGEYLRPVCCWADEAAENFLSRNDSAFQAVARASAGCTVYLAQNINQYRKRLGDTDAFESFVANLQTKVFHQSTGPTCRWAAELLGERWEQVSGISRHTPDAPEVESSSGVSVSEQHRFLVEPSAFTTLKRGGPAYGFEVEAILYKGGHIFRNGLPYKRLRFLQTVNEK